ncbi:MAG: hypothetical protein MGG11_12590 [Trichodesmium sp. MAG_R03]|nr:hypothetical protein [Trichodesmium sp. MAG_R03]
MRLSGIMATLEELLILEMKISEVFPSVGKRSGSIKVATIDAPSPKLLCLG